MATTPSNREFETVPPGRFIALSLEATAAEEGFQEADEVLTRIEYGVLG